MQNPYHFFYDSRNIRLEPGQMVVYNQSGTLAVGTITKINQSVRYGRTAATIHITSEDGYHSKVKNEKSVMVISAL